MSLKPRALKECNQAVPKLRRTLLLIAPLSMILVGVFLDGCPLRLPSHLLPSWTGREPTTDACEPSAKHWPHIFVIAPFIHPSMSLPTILLQSRDLCHSWSCLGWYRALEMPIVSLQVIGYHYAGVVASFMVFTSG